MIKPPLTMSEAVEALRGVSSEVIFSVCATMESAHEPEQKEAATRLLKKWNVTFDEAVSELLRRGVIK